MAPVVPKVEKANMLKYSWFQEGGRGWSTEKRKISHKHKDNIENSQIVVCIIAVTFPRSTRQVGWGRVEGRGHSHLGSAKMGCLEGTVSIKSRLPVRQDKRKWGHCLENSDNHKGKERKVDQKTCYFTDGHRFQMWTWIAYLHYAWCWPRVKVWVLKSSQMGKEAWGFLINDPAGLGCLTTPSLEGLGCALWYRWQAIEPELSTWQVLWISRRWVYTCQNPVIAMGIMFCRASKIQANSWRSS